MWQGQRLGEDVCQLITRRLGYPDETHVTVLDYFVCEVFADVDVLGTLASADNMVPPFDACRVVFVDRSIIALRESFHIMQ